MSNLLGVFDNWQFVILDYGVLNSSNNYIGVISYFT